ncbi:MAG: permease [Candidatus Omnitrophota bacterium]
MNKMLISFFEFFVVLSVMFLIFSFLSHLIMRKISFREWFLFLHNKIYGLGNVASSLIGAVTPFCVCTTIPIFTGMIQMGIKTNIAISFLFSSPLISVSAAVLLYFLFGIKFSVYYIVAALIFSVVGGLLVGWLRLDDAISEELKNNTVTGPKNANIYRNAASSSFRLFRDLFIPLALGAIIAGFIHNYVPVKAIEAINAYPLWITIPLVACIGFPIYSNIMVLAPICFALANKGMNQGAVMTFMMSGAGISFPTVIVLRSLLKTRLFIYYVFYTFISYCMIGFIFNLLR